MVPGFNTDFKYRGETYHVQTEDNGTANPVVVSLLYHKGAILASRKTSYRDFLGKPGFEEQLKTLMKSQHKDLMRELLAGAFDRDGSAPAVAGGTGANPAEAAAAVSQVQPTVASAPAPPPAAPPAPAPAARPLRPPAAAMSVAPPPTAPTAAPAMRRAPAAPIVPAAAPVRATAARVVAPPTLDEAIMRYLGEYAAAAAR